MRLTIWIASLLLITPAWPQHARRTVDAHGIARSTHTAPSMGIHRIRPAVSGAPQSAAPVQAPGVIQTNLFDASNIVWFVTAENLPAGTLLTPYLVFPDQTEIPLAPLQLTEDVPAGSSFDMPGIRTFGPFWPEGYLTYAVVVTMNGTDSQAAADFPVFSARTYQDMTNMVPRIIGTSETLVNRDVTLVIEGSFTREPAYILLEDLVIPRDAVRVSGSQITVNLSKVPQLDLGSLQEFLLTVGQSGWCDTTIFRHTPWSPGSYNAPQ